ncbi:hypothetical protein [Paucibacter sp. KCTC 42545]|uniref:hypothetical protein n=1 Tax=Paucibacter sp. KCTC 42545 TaxID=1768242 RepID=UPI0012E3AE2A|nr:hypothetical protein [Paucibacter sp. KCTC 42545]
MCKLQFDPAKVRNLRQGKSTALLANKTSSLSNQQMFRRHWMMERNKYARMEKAGVLKLPEFELERQSGRCLAIFVSLQNSDLSDQRVSHEGTRVCRPFLPVLAFAVTDES